ncbi:type I-E CRISPR-associated protein Cas6/Cse3/CasE [Arsenicicoccus cauae]|uniref:type I-E CRISPR-associated protein Cas6/Cse3/CasE n=1 Tax=Arsenicicoccus cauae TaxID=2663847 RepID=UPI00370D29A6
MNLSRLNLDTRSAEARRWLASPQVMHARILRQIGLEDPGRVLWRADVVDQGIVELYVLTPEPWDGRSMAREGGGGESSWRSAPYDVLLDRLSPGQRWVFRLTANPTRSIAGARGSRGRVVPHVTASQQEEWLRERARKIGIDIGQEAGQPTYRLVDRRRWQFRRNTEGIGATVSLSTATFEGELRVTDPDLLRTAMTEGIGRGRAYGCGLLTLAPTS